MKIAHKHENVSKINFSDLSGGINLSKNPEAIADNDLQEAENFEYNYLNGQLVTVPGLVSAFAASGTITSMFYFPINNTYIYTTATGIFSTNLTTASSIGILTGGEIPMYELFNDKVMIASGGNLQIWNGTVLTTCAIANPIASGSVVPYILKERDGRLVVIDKAHDYLFYSGVGDETNWTFDDIDSNAKYIEVGYQDGCYITGATFLSTDIIIHKNNDEGTKQRIFKLTNEYPDWLVTMVSETESSVNRFSTVAAMNDAYFFSIGGFKSLSTVTDYGAIKLADAGKKLNSYLIKNFVATDVRLYHVPLKNQIWVKKQNDYYFYIYHYATGAFTRRKLYTGQLNGVVCVNNDVYCAIGSKILKMDDSTYSEDGTSYTSTLKLKKFTSQSDYLVLRTFMNFNVLGVGSGILTVGRYPINIVLNGVGVLIYNNTEYIYNNTDIISQASDVKSSAWMNHRIESIEVILQVASGGLSLQNIELLVTEV